MHGFGRGLPLVESARDANRAGRGMGEFKANGHKLRAGAPDVIMVMIVFHSGTFHWFLWRRSFAEHLCREEDDNGSEKAPASEEIYQGVTSGGKHG